MFVRGDGRPSPLERLRRLLRSVWIGGRTGLTITALHIVTLFAPMQLTGRIRWAEVIRGDLRPD